MHINQIGPEKAVTYGKIYNEYNPDEVKARELIRTSMEQQWDASYVCRFGMNTMLKADINIKIRNYFTKEFNVETGIIKTLKTNCKNKFLSKLFNN